MHGGGRRLAMVALGAIGLMAGCGGDDAATSDSTRLANDPVTRIVLEATDEVTEQETRVAAEIIDQRLGPAGEVTYEPGRIEVELHGASEEEIAAASNLIGRQGQLNLRPVRSCMAVSPPATIDTAPASAAEVEQTLRTSDGTLSCVVGATAATGRVFRNDADAVVVDGQWSVTVGLRPGADGQDLWNRLTAACYAGEPACPAQPGSASTHGQLALELDGVIISAPTVNAPSFEGEVSITGDFSEAEAKQLAKILKFGAVPIRMDVVSIETTGG